MNSGLLKGYIQLLVSALTMALFFMVSFAICLVYADSIMKNGAITMISKVLYLSLLWFVPTTCFAVTTFFLKQRFLSSTPKKLFIFYGCLLTAANILMLIFLISDLLDVGNKIPLFLSASINFLVMVLFPGASALVIGRWITQYEGELSIVEVFLFLGTTLIGWAFYAYFISKWVKRRKMKRMNDRQT